MALICGARWSILCNVARKADTIFVLTPITWMSLKCIAAVNPQRCPTLTRAVWEGVKNARNMEGVVE